MTGNHEFNEVFFENVRVPATQRVGEENRGWYTLAVALDFERSSIGVDYWRAPQHRRFRRDGTRWPPVVEHVDAQPAGATAQSRCRCCASSATALRPSRRRPASPRPSSRRWRSSSAMELNQQITSMTMQVMGMAGQAHDRRVRDGNVDCTATCARWRTPSRAGRARSSATSSRLAGWGCRAAKRGIRNHSPSASTTGRVLSSRDV